MPSPKMGESKSAYISRFISSAKALRDFPALAPRIAVAEQEWERYNNIKKNSPYKEQYLSECPSFQLHFGLETDNVAKEAPEENPGAEGNVDNIQQSARVDITKAVADRQLVFGWANVAIKKDGEFPIDWDQDQTVPEELEKAAYGYVLENEGTDERHDGPTVGHLVESVMFTKEKMEAMGIPEGTIPEGWWVGFWIPDKEIFQKIKTGEYKMFSVGGEGFRTPITQD